MTTKILTLQQVKWAKYLIWFYFMIWYCLEKQNLLVNTLF